MKNKKYRKNIKYINNIKHKKINGRWYICVNMKDPRYKNNYHILANLLNKNNFDAPAPLLDLFNFDRKNPVYLEEKYNRLVDENIHIFACMVNKKNKKIKKKC